MNTKEAYENVLHVMSEENAMRHHTHNLLECPKSRIVTTPNAGNDGAMETLISCFGECNSFRKQFVSFLQYQMYIYNNIIHH
jgi:hypothetical protein